MNTLRTANALLRCNATAHGAIPRTARLAATATAAPLRLPPTPSRAFTTSPSLLKKDRGSSKDDSKPSKKDKRGGGSSSSSPAETPTPKAAETATATPTDPFDFSDLTSAFDKHEKRYLDILSTVRSDGGFNIDTIGAVPVQPDRKSPQTFPLRELAAVAASGARRFTILAFDESSIRPIMSAIQGSESFNQQPQRSEDNPLELTLLLEPVRVDELAKKAKETLQTWRDRLRDETHKREKLHKKWKGDKVVSGDDTVKLKEKMQKLQDERMKGIATKEKQVLASIARKG